MARATPAVARVTPADAPSRAVAPDASSVSRDPVAVRRTERGLRIAVVAVGSAFLAAYIAVVIARMRYPFELEWMEGGVVDDVRRVLSGHSLYVKPSLQFTPYIYTPLYYYVAALPAKVLGVGLFPLRLVSFIASIVAFGCVGALVRCDTDDTFAAFVSACLFAACFRLGGAWFDLARVDSLFLALLFGGLLVARRARTPRGVVLAAALLTLSFLTKQSALIPAVALVVFFWRRRRALAGWYTAALAVGLGGSTLALNLASHGWYRFYAFDVPAAHAIESREYLRFWTADLLAPLWIAILLGAAGMWWATRARTGDGVALAWFHGPVAIALLGTAYQARLHTGGYDNVLLPVFGGLAVLAGLGLHALRSPRRGRAGAWVGSVALVLAIVQLATLTYDPRQQVPSGVDRRTGEHMLAALRALPGTIYLPGHPDYLVRVGKQGSAQSASLEDVMRAHVRDTGRALAREIDRAVASGRYDWIVVDSQPVYSYLPRSFTRSYVRVGTLVSPRHPPLPLTGTLTGPLTVWARRGRR